MINPSRTRTTPAAVFRSAGAGACFERCEALGIKQSFRSSNCERKEKGREERRRGEEDGGEGSQISKTGEGKGERRREEKGEGGERGEKG